MAESSLRCAAPDSGPPAAEEAELISGAVTQVLRARGAQDLTFTPYTPGSVPTWSCGATLRLHREGERLQDFALFGSSNAVAAIARWLFDFQSDALFTGPELQDVLAETLNQVVGRVKEAVVRADGVEPCLDTPTTCGPDASEMYLHTHADSSAVLVSSRQWVGDVLVLASPPKVSTVLAIDEALAVFERFGDRQDGLIKVQRMLDEVSESLRSLEGLPSMHATIEWCTARVSKLVNGVDETRTEQLRGRIHRELSELRRSLAALAAPPEAMAFQLPDDEELCELLEGFCEEAGDVLEKAGNEIRQGGPDLTHALFRAMHTIKGNAGFFGLDQLRELAHSTENMLGLVRDAGHALRGDQLTATERSVSMISEWVQLLSSALEEKSPIEFQPAIEEHRRSIQHSFETGSPVVLGGPSELNSNLGRLSQGGVRLSAESVARLQAVEQGLCELLARAEQEPQVCTLDDFVEQLRDTHGSLSSTLRSMNTVQLTRLFSKIARLCRETADGLGKVVRVETSGDHLEVPRHLVSALSGPMVHLARNAIDHGLEDAEERRESGKDILARVEVRAYWQDGCLVVEVVDDGRGVSTERVLEKARSRGLVGPDDQLTKEQTLALLLEPGFSTAEKTTELSGRGVGMDVVRREVENSGGRIYIQSTLGSGSTFKIVLPEDRNTPLPEIEEAKEEELPAIELEDTGELTFL